jgi:hypothetical protein
MARSDQRQPFGGPVWPGLDRLEVLFRAWAASRPDRVALRQEGPSIEGRPIFVLALTDPSVPDEDKEHVLVTGLHSGVERSGTTAICALIEWLLAEDLCAAEILRHQRVVCVPVPDPDNYQRGRHGPGYAEWTPSGPTRPTRMPEALLIQRLLDELQPEVHADLHGMSLSFETYHILENSGVSYSNPALRPYQHGICELMDEAALRAGFCSDRPACDDELLLWGPDLNGIVDRLWRGRPRYYAALYAYHHFHSLILASEVAWEDSGVARHRALLEIGNRLWPGELYPGYPTRVVASNSYHMVTAYGATATERRRSRSELWSRRGQLTLGMVDPNVEGRAAVLCATQPATARQWLQAPHLAGWLRRLSGHPAVAIEPLRSFFADWPAGQNAPEPVLAMEWPGAVSQSRPIELGLCLRLRLFYPEAKVTELLLNGHPVGVGERDGYTVWHARGMTFVQIAIPPERCQDLDLFVATCRYEPGQERHRWQVEEALRRAART